MKPRHAAALALVGRYLLTPPISYDTKTSGLRINFKAPLDEWTITGDRFASKESCMKALRGRDHLAEEAGKSGDAESKEAWRQAYAHARCGVLDDSRVFLPDSLSESAP